jgi:uncharacterized damage-inducible protein DinB
MSVTTASNAESTACCPDAAAILAELEREAPATRRALARVPMEKLDWRPHPKSMSVGQLAIHVAGIPGNLARLSQGPGFDVASRPPGPPAQPEPNVDLVRHLDEGLAQARAILSTWTDADAEATWRLSNGDKEVFAIPRRQMVRTMLLNHWYHHRGQLQVYLRLLDVPVPVVYGRSADEGF